MLYSAYCILYTKFMDFPLNLAECENFLSCILPKAGEIAKRYFKNPDLHFKNKSEHEIVTDADIAINDYLCAGLTLEYPDFPIFSEESNRMETEKYRESDAFWVIDPIDGTNNFARGMDLFAISIALCQKDRTLQGSVYSPVRNEWYQAREDIKGAFRNGEEIHAGSKNTLQNIKVAVDFGYSHDARKEASSFIQKMIKHTNSIYSLGCATLAQCQIAEGSADIYRSVGLKPWDQAAAAFIAQKAGAKVLNGQGGEWNIFSESILLGKEGIIKKVKKELA
ncbi:hypothetical protein A3D77_02585 [Candidatus Gottesmanbacteria bacterium RIFCSPHIGHO2_02_FULL_39_11]|uniref:Inositol-phosphate phosphatase n=1 Tax=Candidatus Gottesmanbacteria bacterium RIFCSPHIGHO2_02_FULL_39_11 TaxID=1798382 RepID=A0A1F5ZSW2_9BACT|nr:MAG: hypothetical protein A3D77_02585 [Candidatus Gottesmanbacteria bacterium RIFCSPHIGHO2_02_FULL_39_11]